ncbi:cytochrome P450 [Trametes versicolor FP-101664 SS1]|uniref:cytochrome P450 n=1 Tax=Trametes versicolor (strain FP-101664) TaxID=717944 RepID=UPI000462228E|nr:cytochrome P450 [Trametes versicolor FP-101664 SS1]EIW61094.1 cytochrome P450 [Trametes versicolor FP-101664 SS1]
MLALLAQATVICSLCWIFWKFFRQVVVKSPLDNIPGPPRESFPGNLRQILDRHAWPVYEHLTEAYPGIAKLAGPLGTRMLYVFDPVAMHNIIVKDQYVFEEAAWFIKSNKLNFGPGLLATLGDHHRKQRKLLNPVFSIAHMRRMIPIFNEVTHRLQKAIECRVIGRDGPVELDMLNWMGRTALELIGQSGLGYSFDPLVADSSDEFLTAIKAFQPTIMQLSVLRRIVPYLPEFGPPWFRRKLVELIPNKNVQKLRHIVDTMHERAVGIYQEKKRMLEQGDEALKDKVGEGKDLMSILLRANMAASDDDKLPEEELIGQVATFIFAAMDTTSNALSITLSLLAEHPDVQEKLRKEIIEASNGEDLGYDTLVSLPYLDAVCRETLRLHSPVTTVFRETRSDAVLPLSEPITGIDGSKINEIHVPKDTTVVVGVLSSNRNKAIWGEDALEWKPERWLDQLPESVTEAKIPGIYSNLMTFLGGGRACIGFKFSQLEMKVVLCQLLTKFTFAPSAKPVVWNLSGVRFPTVAEATKPSMPMMVGLYKEPAVAA